MNQPTEVPSRLSIAALATLAALVIVAAFWIGYAPAEVYTARHAVGFVLGLALGVDVLLQATCRARRRMVMREAQRRYEAAIGWPEGLRFATEPDDGAHNG